MRQFIIFIWHSATKINWIEEVLLFTTLQYYFVWCMLPYSILKIFIHFNTMHIFLLSGLWQPRHSPVLVEVCGDLQRSGCHGAAGDMVLGSDGGTFGQWEVPVPQVCVGQDPATQVNCRLQGERLCSSGVYFLKSQVWSSIFVQF